MISIGADWPTSNSKTDQMRVSQLCVNGLNYTMPWAAAVQDDRLAIGG
jgi:hypothetical protein